MAAIPFISHWKLDGYSLIDPNSLINAPAMDPEAIRLFLGKANSFTAHINRRYSEGYVLATGLTLAALLIDINPTQRELSVGNDETLDKIVIKNLYIENCTAITPGVVVTQEQDPDEDPGVMRQVAPTTLSPETVYLVHLVDCRFFGEWTSLDELKLNWLDADGELVGSQNSTYEDILTEIWTSGKLFELLGPLSFVGGAQLLATQQYRFSGESAWEAFNRVLEDAGCIVVPNPTHETYEVYSAGSMIGLPAGSQTAFDRAKLTRLIDAEGSLVGPRLPATIRVHFHTTGQQFYECDNTETPQDCWQDLPHDIVEFDTYTLLQPLAEDNLALTLAIIDNTTLSLWSPLIAYVNESGQYVDYPDDTGPGESPSDPPVPLPGTGRTKLEDALEDYALDYLLIKWNTGHTQAWTFSGFMNMPLSDSWAQWTIFDYGDGIKTQFKARQAAPLLPQREYPGKPDVHRRNTPYTRIAYAQLIGSSDAVPALDTELTDKATGSTDEAKAVILYTRGGKWYSTGVSAPVAKFSTPFLKGKFYHCHYNYQAGDYGKWYPFGGSGGSTGGCLATTHPGRGVPFDIRLGYWSSADDKWIYSASGTVKAIDWRYGVPYPAAGATGLFEPRESDTYGTIWENVSLDCESPGSCGA